MSKKALIVDDSRTMREMVAMTIKKIGFEIIKAEDGVDALKQLGDEIVDVVITDLNMPNMNGFELIRALRKKQNYLNTPILMLTTETSDEKKTEGRNAGATGWIVKPFDPAKLITVINKVCL